MDFNNYTIPNLKNKTVIITGACSGIGFYVAKVMAKQQATVILACRNNKKALKAINQIKKQTPAAKCEYIHLDLQSFASVKKFAKTVDKTHPTIDILINNAGVIKQNINNKSKDGFDPHISTNCLGHFLLTNMLLKNLKNSNSARIVTVSSFIEKTGFLGLKKFAKDGVSSWISYTQSKVANLTLSYELNHKLKQAGITNIKSVASHPGVTISNSKQITGILKILHKIGMPIEQGSMSLIIAATSPNLKGGEYIGYDGILNLNGCPCLNKSSKTTHNRILAQQLWKKCEDLTNIKFKV